VARILPLVAVVVVAVAPVRGQDAIEPISLHQLELEAHRNVPTSPDLIGSGTRSIMPLQTRAAGTQLCRTVFGYLPYWESSANLRYDLLTHIACFSVGANGDGSISNPNGWPWTALINTAHANGVKITLVATQFNTSTLLTLVSNATYKSNFFVNIKNQMLAGNADGINIDFEGSGTWISYVNGFMTDLTAYMHAQVPGCEVTFAGPIVNYGSWNLPGLAASCDGIFIMGYAFWGSWSTTSGPNSPLTGGTYNITNSIVGASQYGPVTASNPEKLILGVPYYGGHWTTTTSAPRAPRVSWVSSTRFYNDEPNSAIYGLQWETLSQTPWYYWNDGTNWHQVWFDNAQSLGLKYQLAQDHNLQGVGMWALNYDGTRPELWNELETRFKQCGGPVFGDVDRDGDIDLTDYYWLALCMIYSGPGLPLAPTHFCLANYSPDLDGDLDIDMTDYAAFAGLMAPSPPPCTPLLLTGFEGYANGTEVLFRNPRYSGSTSANLTTTPDVNDVTDEVAAFSGATCFKLQWQFVDTATTRWMRATSHIAANVPNPTILLDKPIRVRLRLDSGSLLVSLGIRETGTSAAPGQDGGTTGTIEWVGATGVVGTNTPQGKPLNASPGVWQTLVFDPLTDPITPFTGDGVLSTPTNKGTLEELAFSSTGGAGPFTVYIDDVEQLCN
jgi:spore germination protein YaaH